jgi:hypothetical protein
MTSQYPALITGLLAAVQGDAFWEPRLAQLATETTPAFALHLGIFVEPYLQYILDGLKTVESRFATRRFAPYQQVATGDVLLLKQTSGPIVGLCQIAHVWFYRLDPHSWQTIRTSFAQALCAQDPDFWAARAHASFATLMRVQHVRAIVPIGYQKRDRRGWVVLRPAAEQLELSL